MKVSLTWVVPPPIVGDVILTLTAYEAYVLWAITYHIGGPPEGPRGVTDDFRNRLEIQFPRLLTDGNASRRYHSITVDGHSILMCDTKVPMI